MYSFFRTLMLMTLLVLSAGIARATHIFGADFYYEHVSGMTYKVTLALYGDCSGANFPALTGAVPIVQVHNNGSFFQNLSLSQESPGVEVTPVCPSEINNTTCKGGTVPGVTRFIYSATVTLPAASANWHFFFTGSMGSSTSAGRSNSITNIIFSGSGSSSVMGLDAMLNNLSGPNSSPRFTTIPTPFYCINVAQQYNQGAVDANNDSLDYALAPAIDQNATQVSYQQPFSAAVPLATAPGSFSFDHLTGQMNFTPDQTQKSLVVNQVVEYRNGVIVGTATREMTFVVLANCNNNTPPTSRTDSAVTTVAGGLFEGQTGITICEGTPSVHFGIRPTDPTNDTINVTVNGLPAGATANVVSNNTPAPSVIVDWNTSTVAPGNYNFFVTLRDNGCPFSSQQTQAYTLRVIRPSQATYRTLYPTECAHKALIEYRFSAGTLPRDVTVKQGNNVLRTFTDSTGVYRDSLAEGVYTLHISSPQLTCASDISLVVRDSGIYPYPPVITDAFYCLNDPAMALQATPAAGGSIFWYDSLQRRINSAPVPNTSVAGITAWYAVQQVKVCESRPDTGLIYITKKPVADFVSDPELCNVDTMTVRFSGSIGVGPIIAYQWDWDGGAVFEGHNEGPFRVRWSVPGQKVVRLQVFENKCPSDPVSRTVRVKPTPTATFTVDNVCVYDSVTVQYTGDSVAGQQYAWQFTGAQIAGAQGHGPYRLHWPAAGTERIFLRVSKDGCFDTLSRYPVIQPAPEARIWNVPGAVCIGDKVYLSHSGGTTYKWMPAKDVVFDSAGRPYTNVLRPTTYRLTVRNEFGCADSASVTYDRVDPCCMFSYPTAFTPNNDGLNDRFRVVTYGNDESYSLTIFNRWGQAVFHTASPKDGWDGRLNGRDCEMGTYYYVLKARCFTGHEESQQGEFTLVR